MVDVPAAAERVIAFVAVKGRRLARDYVAESLWADTARSNAQSSLRSALYSLRQRSGSALTASKRYVELNADVRVDLADWSHAARRLALRGPTPPDEDAVYGCIDALSLDLLPDWYDEWLTIDRERWTHARLHALESLSGKLMRAGRFPAAVDAALAAIAAEPLRESAHRRLVEIHLAQGNVGAAVKQYRMCAGLLARELGVAPTEQLRSLVTPFVDRPRRP